MSRARTHSVRERLRQNGLYPTKCTVPLLIGTNTRSVLKFTLVVLSSFLIICVRTFRESQPSLALTGTHAIDICDRSGEIAGIIPRQGKGMATGLTIIVNSHVGSSHATDCLVTNMLSLGLNSTCSVIVVLGGAKEPNERVDDNDIRWISVTHDTVDLNGLIWASESFDDRWFVYVHDTVAFGRKINSVLMKLHSSLPSTRKLRRYPSMNMGTYLTTDLRRPRVHEKLDHIKHLYATLNSTERKLQAILDEDVVFKAVSAPTMGGLRFATTNWLFRLFRSLQGKKEFDDIPVDVYGTGTLRTSRYHPNLDLFKFTANFNFAKSGNVVTRNLR